MGGGSSGWCWWTGGGLGQVTVLTFFQWVAFNGGFSRNWFGLVVSTFVRSLFSPASQKRVLSFQFPFFDLRSAQSALA